MVDINLNDWRGWASLSWQVISCMHHTLVGLKLSQIKTFINAKNSVDALVSLYIAFLWTEGLKWLVCEAWGCGCFWQRRILKLSDSQYVGNIAG